MKYRAVIKQVDDWWIGWLVDLPGVNAQEENRNALIESLKIGAEDMLATQIHFEPESTMIVVEVPSHEWSSALA
ncbi:MAG: type II toxin-antitoxin system HicB family antitoxin [Chloroflexi bacterium]|nr:type II toxin-antitoxin system HicB family antitoxin [Chloroflexota bacterium]